MKHFFDFPKSLLDYFQNVDKRMASADPMLNISLSMECFSDIHKTIKAVLWDVYGTLAGFTVGDLENSLENYDSLTLAASQTIDEFQLAEALQLLFPQLPPETALQEFYLQLINESHIRSQNMGIEYPEVLIEMIWERILDDCHQQGYIPPYEEPLSHTAFRCAYFFDSALQQTYLYPGVGQCLKDLKNSGIIQGIISNAQFYTPFHLRRLLRHELKCSHLELDDYFTDSLVLFSYELGFSKPNPRAFQHAIKILEREGIEPNEILYIGNDMLNDIWAASQEGLQTAFFAGDQSQALLRNDDERCHNIKPNMLFINHLQLSQAIL
jgi:putative hydrolase of the HAD superfamily